ncbi:MAG: bifunctional folylpolyglutamate synthase/dihydrofolate synthase [Deltaproteobacteria bacterium]|nr:bifunctional folylpolyglutamate synthase/dihydrofolate synthase [Deltaproteobacteria bacterium]
MQDPLEYLDGLNSANIRLGLGPVSRLLDRLNNPHKTYGSVLIGGTNGKGSIAAMVASVLEKGGIRVGLYTSPHLTDIRERIRVNGRMITREEMISCVEDVRKEVSEDITYFECLTAVAFLHFCRVRIHVAVLEVGMGGRLDATNVVKPLVSVISNISLDHRNHLGNSLAAIACEKGGIIKNKGVCITAAKQTQVVNILEDICMQRRATLFMLGRDMKVRMNRDGTFNYRGIWKDYENLICSLKGRHQIENAALAIGAVESMREKGFEMDDEAVWGGIRSTKWEGRLEILQHEPMVLIDGAHNPAGISTLCRALETEFSYKRLIFIFGVLNDKDYGSMLKRIAPLTDRLIITRPQTERATPPGEILPVALRYNHRNVEVIENSRDALKRALSLANLNDLICVAGSLYLVGEMKRVF